MTLPWTLGDHLTIVSVPCPPQDIHIYEIVKIELWKYKFKKWIFKIIIIWTFLYNFRLTKFKLRLIIIQQKTNNIEKRFV